MALQFVCRAKGLHFFRSGPIIRNVETCGERMIADMTVYSPSPGPVSTAAYSQTTLSIICVPDACSVVTSCANMPLSSLKVRANCFLYSSSIALLGVKSVTAIPLHVDQKSLPPCRNSGAASNCLRPYSYLVDPRSPFLLQVHRYSQSNMENRVPSFLLLYVLCSCS